MLSTLFSGQPQPAPAPGPAPPIDINSLLDNLVKSGILKKEQEQSGPGGGMEDNKQEYASRKPIQVHKHLMLLAVYRFVIITENNNLVWLNMLSSGI